MCNDNRGFIYFGSSIEGIVDFVKRIFNRFLNISLCVCIVDRVDVDFWMFVRWEVLG